MRVLPTYSDPHLTYPAPPTDVAKDGIITPVMATLATATVDELWSKNKRPRDLVSCMNKQKTHMTELV